jgi:type IX secretion system PorP/SprF family membrane protein
MKKLFSLLIILGIYSHAFPQDISFSHLNHSKLFINPGFAGTEKISNLTVSHRNLSPEEFGNYITYRASYNQYLNLINGGLGIQFIQDNQGNGAINRSYFSGIYSYRIKLEKNLILNPALEMKFASYSLNTNDLILPSMFDQSSWTISKDMPDASLHRSANYLEFNTGVILRYINEYLRTYRDFTVGLAFHHLNKPVSLMDPENQINRKVSLYFDIELFLSQLETYQSSTLLIPSFLYTQQLNSNLFQYGTYLKYKNVFLGGFIKHNSAFQYVTPIFQVGAELDEFHISYSYDAGFLNYKRISVFSGAHEVTLSVNFSIKGMDKQ